MTKKTGIDWVAISDKIGVFDNQLHPLTVIADHINDSSYSMEHESKIWDAAIKFMIDPKIYVSELAALTKVNKMVWLHLWCMYEPSGINHER
jgi:hypothetical protein